MREVTIAVMILATMTVVCRGSTVVAAEDWCFVATAEITSFPVVGDVDGDGHAEVLAASSGWIAVLNACDGRIKAKVPVPDVVSMVVGDVNGDGTCEVVVCTRDGRVICKEGRSYRTVWEFRASGTPFIAPSLFVIGGQPFVCFGTTGSTVYCLRGDKGIPRWVFMANNKVYSSAAIGHIGKKAVVVLSSVDGRIYVLDALNGDQLWRFRVNGVVDSSPTLADVDGDGSDEIIFGSWNGRVYCIDPGTKGRVWEFVADGPIYSSPVAGDVDADGSVETAFVDWSGKVYEVDARGKLVWSATLEGRVTVPLSASDVDDDGVVDIVVGLERGKLVILDGETGAKKLELTLGDDAITPAAIGDIDGDGFSEVVLGTRGRKVLCFEVGKAGKTSWLLQRGSILGRGCPGASATFEPCAPPAARGEVRIGLTDWLNGEPIISDGTLFVASRGRKKRESDPRDGVYAIDLSSMKYRWFLKTSNDVYSLSMKDGFLVAVTRDGEVLEISPSGSVLRKLRVDSFSCVPPVFADINGDGTEEVIVCLFNGAVEALTAEGYLLWRATTEGPIFSVPILTETSTGANVVVVGSDDDTLYAIEATSGRTVWKFRTGGDINCGIVEVDGGIIFGSHDGFLYMLSRDGDLLWKTYVGGRMYGMPDVGSAAGVRVVVVATTFGKVCAVALDGKKVWERTLDAGIVGQPRVFGGEVYVVTLRGSLYRMDLETGRVIMRERIGARTGMPVVVTDTDGDGNAEIIAALSTGFLKVFRGR